MDYILRILSSGPQPDPEDPCMRAIRTDVIPACFTTRDRTACCSALDQPAGCSAAWAATFETYVGRARGTLFFNATGECDAAWPCLFPSVSQTRSRRSSPCFRSECADLFRGHGALTLECARTVSSFCDVGVAGDTDVTWRCERHARALEKCPAGSPTWRVCASGPGERTIPETAARARASVATAIAVRLTNEESAWTGAGLNAYGAQTAYVRAFKFYDPLPDPSHPHYVRVSPLDASPPAVPYYTTTGTLNIAFAVATLVLMHVVDLICTRSRRHVLLSCV